ncbi:MAG TPA: glycyl-radical enzyme activating protein [Dehalococcoidia bacterium]|nr:glycyl-radical enzyme activating protein [Dehalococcoidia bacterium]
MSTKDTLQKALVFDIQRFSIHDGPGIRTAIFFKGCPLRCRWCQNPEGLDPGPEISFCKDRCLGCRECQAVCPLQAILFDGPRRIDRRLCDRCGKCVEVCHTGALQLIGRPYTPEGLLSEVLRDVAFFDASGGGITLSGGEPTYQLEFLTAFLPLAKGERLHIAMETCGYVSYEKLRTIIPFLNLILYDIKAIDSALHRRLTRRSNATILENLKRLLYNGVAVQVRVPLIPCLTATEDNLRDIALFLRDQGINEVDLLPYHKMGESKLERIDSPLRPLNLSTLDDGEVTSISALFQDAGLAQFKS